MLIRKDWFTCCKNCDKRYLGCHDRCEEYRTQKAQKEQIASERRKQVELDRLFFAGFKKGEQK